MGGFSLNKGSGSSSTDGDGVHKKKITFRDGSDPNSNANGADNRFYGILAGLWFKTDSSVVWSLFLSLVCYLILGSFLLYAELITVSEIGKLSLSVIGGVIVMTLGKLLSTENG